MNFPKSFYSGQEVLRLTSQGVLSSQSDVFTCDPAHNMPQDLPNSENKERSPVDVSAFQKICSF